MNIRRMLIAGALALFAATSVHAVETLVTADIPFQFSVGKKLLPAGHYEFLADDAGKFVTVRATPSGSSALGMVVTRLAAGIHTTLSDAHVVFDKVGASHTLAEIWTVGKDGYALSFTEAPHEHEIIDVPLRR